MGIESIVGQAGSFLVEPLRKFYRLSGAHEEQILADVALPINHRDPDPVQPNYTEAEYIRTLMHNKNWTEAEVMEYLGGKREGKALEDTQIMRKQSELGNQNT